MEMAKTSIPTIISTGMATVAEIDDAVRAFEEANGKELIILHCVSSYPTPPDQVNLNKITSLKNAFGYPVGFSDHTDGIVAAIGSVVLGSCFIEKHFTLDKNLPGPDHHFSCDKKELEQLVDAIRIIEKNMGVFKIGPTKVEERGRKDFRLSCVAVADFSVGHKLKLTDITFSRPSGGLAPKLSSLLINKELKRYVKAGEWITIEDII